MRPAFSFAIINLYYYDYLNFFRTFDDKEEAERGFKVVSGFSAAEQKASSDDTEKEQKEHSSCGKRKREETTVVEDDDDIIVL